MAYLTFREGIFEPFTNIKNKISNGINDAINTVQSGINSVSNGAQTVSNRMKNLSNAADSFAKAIGVRDEEESQEDIDEARVKAALYGK